MGTKKWTQINILKRGRDHLALYFYNNQLTVLGGYGTKSIEVMNENGTWEYSQDSLHKGFNYGVSVEVKCPV